MSDENILKKHRSGLFNGLKERWPDITQADIDYIAGDVQGLIEVVQRRGHISAAAAKDNMDDFFGRPQIHKASHRRCPCRNIWTRNW